MIKAKKKLGQNFLVSNEVLAHITDFINPQDDQIFCEIGCGTGALTQQLVDKSKYFIGLELDQDLIPKLQHLFQYQLTEKMELIHIDALIFDYTKVAQKFRIVGNLPYYIASALLIKCISFKQHLIDAHFMLQQELVQRICSAPNNRNYGRLSVILQYHFDCSKLMTISAQHFSPVPKVESALLRLVPKQPQLVATSEAKLSSVVKQAFAHKRKKIRNNLQQLTNKNWQDLSINPDLRAENLSVNDFVRLSNYCLTKNL